MREQAPGSDASIAVNTCLWRRGSLLYLLESLFPMSLASRIIDIEKQWSATWHNVTLTVGECEGLLHFTMLANEHATRWLVRFDLESDKQEIAEVTCDLFTRSGFHHESDFGPGAHTQCQGKEMRVGTSRCKFRWHQLRQTEDKRKMGVWYKYISQYMIKFIYSPFPSPAHFCSVLQ